MTKPGFPPPAGRPALPARGRHAVGVARIALRRVAMPASTHAASPSIGIAEPCAAMERAWSSGLWGVFLPDRRREQMPLPTAFVERRLPAPA